MSYDLGGARLQRPWQTRCSSTPKPAKALFNKRNFWLRVKQLSCDLCTCLANLFSYAFFAWYYCRCRIKNQNARDSRRLENHRNPRKRLRPGLRTAMTRSLRAESYLMRYRVRVRFSRIQIISCNRAITAEQPERSLDENSKIGKMFVWIIMLCKSV